MLTRGQFVKKNPVTYQVGSCPDKLICTHVHIHIVVYTVDSIQSGGFYVNLLYTRLHRKINNYCFYCKLNLCKTK